MPHPGELPGEGEKISSLTAGIGVSPVAEKTDVHGKCQKKQPSGPAVWWSGDSRTAEKSILDIAGVDDPKKPEISLLVIPAKTGIQSREDRDFGSV